MHARPFPADLHPWRCLDKLSLTHAKCLCKVPHYPDLHNALPCSLLTLDRVGTGLTVAERDELHALFAKPGLLLPLGAPPPRNLAITGRRDERPDQWVRDISSSVVMEVCEGVGCFGVFWGSGETLGGVRVLLTTC